MAVVGFDNLGMPERADPPLTTVHQSIQALGTEMTRMLIGLIGGQGRTPLILPTKLVLRESA
ncbi:substrate-binding domain-containing protein [Paractinoplanes toevensis]|uniref:Transcriptional regulator LacI/GalR-like sensor domain-containing protein n=1 Tax=Paractinoplanes toevensis TaxID=571911 RepID=A0A919TC08_9ACTN|nr:substrate-binding domain-containing protein [Actinoplanes toevensis]GIM93219.1 hypothetical protein Ato02nite_050120 [Actinoplanes toevensis]